MTGEVATGEATGDRDLVPQDPDGETRSGSRNGCVGCSTGMSDGEMMPLSAGFASNCKVRLVLRFVGEGAIGDNGVHAAVIRGPSPCWMGEAGGPTTL